MRARLFGSMREFDAVAGVVRADAGDDVRAVANGINNGADDAFLLVVSGRGRLAGGAVDDQSVVAVVDQIRRQSLRTLEVETAVRGEGRDHRGEHPAKRRGDGVRS